MSYQEKRSVVNLIFGALIMAAYCIYAYGKYQAGAADLYDLKFFALTMLAFIGIGIVASIVIQIIFHIVLSAAIAVKQGLNDDKEIGRKVEAAFKEDEMDKLIELKSGRLAIGLAGAGFIGGLVTLALGIPPAVMLNLLYLSWCLGSLAGGVSSLYYYRAGIR